MQINVPYQSLYTCLCVQLMANRISSDILSRIAYNRVCLVRPTGGYQQVRALVKGSDVGSIHESLVATCGDENASLSLY